MINKINDSKKWLAGSKKLPAGAIPLAQDDNGVICLTPLGEWISWRHPCIKIKNPFIQRDVMSVLVRQMGGTSSSMAQKLDISTRTIEGWRSGKSKLTIKSAYKIAQQIENLNNK